jgi:hypothetical protein
MKDLDKLTKAELKKLLKKTKTKHKKKTKAKHIKTHHVINEPNENMSDRMIEQKPIIARTNPIQPVQYMPQGFGGSSSIDQRNNDIMRGQLNETNNKLITMESKHNNEKEKYEIRNKQSEIEHNRLMEKIKYSNEAKRIKEERAQEKRNEKAKNPLADVKSNRMDRDVYIEKSYFKDNDNIDVPTTEPEFYSDIIEQEEDVKQDEFIEQEEDVKQDEFIEQDEYIEQEKERPKYKNKDEDENEEEWTVDEYTKYINSMKRKQTLIEEAIFQGIDIKGLKKQEIKEKLISNFG